VSEQAARTRPRLSEWRRYPVTSVTSLLATIVSLAYWSKFSLGLFLPDDAGVRQGQIWRFVTDVFPHGSIMHLAFNLYWLWVFGTCVEAVLGRARTAGLFLLLAFGSSAVQFAVGASAIGLSGVGYGLFGMLWLLSSRDGRFQGAVDKNTVVIFILWLGFCYWMTYTHAMNVGNAAHLTGLALGCLVAVAIARPRARIVVTAAITAILLFGLWGSTFGRPLINGFEQARLGYEALEDMRYEEGAKWFRKAVALEPREGWMWYDLGVTSMQVNDYETAHIAFARASRLEPGNLKYMRAAASHKDKP